MRCRSLVRLLAIVLAIGGGRSVFAQGGPQFLEDDGHIALFEHDGSNYDKLTPSGEPNVAPRQALVRRFLETHGDFYDFVVIFTNFEFERGEARGFYLGVRNDVSGIGASLTDLGASFGSPKRLQGVIDMGPILQYRDGGFSVDPSDPRFRATVGVLAHEIGHRWLARVQFLDGAEVSSDLLGDDGNHWSYLLSSGASLLYGSRWDPEGGGLYRASEVLARYSPLDLYLMGLAEPEEVPLFVLLRNPDVDPKALPELGAVVSATEQTVTLDQILAVEGARTPDASSSQKDFRLGFLFLSKENVVPAPFDIDAVERIREAIVSTFFSLTKGRGFVDTDLLNVIPPVPTATPDTALALDWLLAQQQADGRFEDHPLTSLRDTEIALETLELLGVVGEPLTQAGSWLSTRTPSTVDALSRAIAAGTTHPIEPLLSAQNADGGFGIAKDYRSDPLDTALALVALTRRGAPDLVRGEATDFLVSAQTSSGGFRAIAGTPPDVATTCMAAKALQEAGTGATSAAAALGWLVSVQQPDGGFGDGPSTPYATACAVEVLLNGGAPGTVIDGALEYLRKTQRPDGSWEGGAYETAEVLHALVPASVANLEIRTSDLSLDPSIPEVGETVSIEVTVRNRSRVGASSFLLELFDGDPELGGVALGSTTLASLAAGASSSATFSWDTSGLEGEHTLFAVADMAGAVPELNRADNVATRNVDVLPPLPNLVLESLASTPASPASGVTATIAIRTANRGSVASEPSSLVLYEGHPSLSVIVGELSVPALAPGQSFEGTLSWDTSGKLGKKRLVAVADPSNLLRERLETDNERALDLDVRTPPPPEPDLVLEKKDLTLTPSPLTTLPETLTLTARIRNTGASPVSLVRVDLYLGSPASGGLALDATVVDVPGDGDVTVSFAIPVTTGGSRSYFVAVDLPNDVVERNEANNVAGIDLVDPMASLDIALDPASLSLSAASLTAGETLSVGIDVQNRGTRRLTAQSVSLFAETLLASTTRVDLAPGASTHVTLPWKANRLGGVALTLRADPDDLLAETDETNNLVTTSVDVASSGLPNLTVGSAEIEVTPPTPIEGEPATVSARIRNVADVDAGGFDVSFFGGDPDHGGIPLGTRTVSALLAGGDVIVTVDWPEVQLRGTTLLTVLVDTGAAVEEFDEADNRAFRVVDIQGLADLAVSTGALRLDPPFGRSGDPVTLEASFANQGELEALDVTAEVRLDDPVTGTVLASETVALLLPGEVTSFPGLWDTTGIEGEHRLYLVVDPGDVVREQREDNNVAIVPAALQDADRFVSPLYFSPDGNGVQDEAVFFYRASAAPVSVRVEDGRGRLVRRLETEAPAEGSVSWDGRRDDGVLARDGEYQFVLASAAGELSRQRVVLDTNRSSVVDALGSEYVGFSTLTCPLAGFGLSGPAFSPDDGAAYFLTRNDGEPGYPAGLYRASADGSLLELLATGSDFADLSFYERVLPFAAQRIVSPDGRRAVVVSASAGLGILDLASGALTSLGYVDADARWSPDGTRLLVASFDGIFLHSPTGELQAQLSALGAELAEWSPDASRIAYRPWDETVLHVMNADGSSDRALPATDATALLGDTGGSFDPSSLTIDGILWTRGGDSLVFEWFENFSEQLAGPFELDLATEALAAIPGFSEVSADQEWTVDFPFGSIRRFRGRERRVAAEGEDLHWSYRDTYLSYRSFGTPGCPGANATLVRTLLNGEAQFRLAALPSGFGVRIAGTVADRNLDHYRLEYAPLRTPDALVPYRPIQAPSRTPVVNDTITTWIPPAPGDYLVRLTLRDLAGNEVVRLDRVRWAKTLPIAGLKRAPQAISPNGDGVSDEVRIDYSVLDVVNLVFRVRNESGTVVRTIIRDEATLGPVSFVWDGTDETGAAVPDGNYVVEVSGAELPVLVDRTPPTVEGTYSELYTNAEGHLAVDLLGRVQDEHLEEWSLEAPDEAKPIASSVRPLGSASEPELLLEGEAPVPGLELRARDLAGNVTVLPLAGPSREVRIVHRRFERFDAAVGPFEPGPPADVPLRGVRPLESFSFTAETSFPPSTGLRFVYGEEGATQTTELATPFGIASLRGEDLPVGRRFVGHFEADGVVSQDVSFLVGPDALFADFDPRASVPILQIHSTLEEELVEGTLYISVNGVRQVLQTFAPVPRGTSLRVPGAECGATVLFHVEAVGESGTRYFSSTYGSYPRPGLAVGPRSLCMGVEDVGIQRQSAPEAPLPDTAFTVGGQSLSPAPEAIAILLEGGGSTTEVARTVPNDQRFAASFDVSGVPEGSYVLSSRAELSGGEIREGDYGLDFFLDQTPPSASILSPAEGGSACVVQEQDAEWIDLDVGAEDHALDGYSVELLTTGGWESQPTKLSGPTPMWPLERFERTVRVRIPAGLEGTQSFRLTMASRRISDESSQAPPPPPGRTRSFPKLDNNGTILGTAVRNLIVVRRKSLEELTASPSLFSPNGDGVLDEAHVVGRLVESASLTVRVYPESGLVPVRTIVNGASQGEGIFDVVWDGLDEHGVTVADGKYIVEVVAVNGCGASSTRRTGVQVDRTPPTAALTAPTDLQPISTAVEVRGVAEDENFASYTLEFGAGPSPTVFEPVSGPVTHRVADGALGVWNIGELPEALYTLRLTAADRAGNESTTSVLVDVVAPELILRFETEPSLISPNGDGVLEDAELRFRLARDAEVTLTLRRPDDTIAATLLANESFVAGDHVLIWDGALPDGDYVAHLSATDAVNAALLDEASLSITVDRAPPTISILSPLADAFVALPSSIAGDIADSHLERYTVELAPEGGGLSRLHEDSAPASGAITSLLGWDDGRYRLVVRASDLAGNVAETEVGFDIDSTPPVVEIRAPVADAPIATSVGSLVVRGRVLEANLESYTLEVGYGESPLVFVPLVSGASGGPDVEASWDVSVLPDGAYTVRLRATDRAGKSVETRRAVVLDGTPPTVSITFPEEDAYLRQDAEIVGTATDDHFTEATVEIARAGAPLQVLAKLDAPVTEGLLHAGLPLDDGDYHLALRAKDAAGNVALVERNVHIDSKPPASPEGVRASVEQRTNVRITWPARKDSPDNDVAGYLVSRDGVLLTETATTELQYLDAGLAEGRYRYTVVAVDRAGSSSEPSFPVEARVDLTPPTVLLRSPDDGAKVRALVDVVGTAYAENDFKEYRLSVASEATPLRPTLLKRSPVAVSFQTLFQWEAVALDGAYLLTLEGEDTSGNVATDTVRVLVDNDAPAPPVLTSVATPTVPEDVEVIWEASASTDVSGYLVYRNGEIANAPGLVAGDLRPYLVSGSPYVDADLPDGRFCYRIVAMDEAGNLSFESNEICIVLDNHDPSAILVEPADGARFDVPTMLRAVVDDEDVATVLFQYQPAGGSAWSDIGVDAEAPFEILWDITGLPFGDYRLRAVATDAGNRTDPAPATIQVVLGDSTPPAVPAGLVAAVDGDAVTLTWDEVVDAGLAGYRVYRDDALIEALVPGTTYGNAGVSVGAHFYQVSAVDADENESERSEKAPARVYRPVLRPAFPVLEGTETSLPGGTAEANADVELFTEAGTTPIASTVADGEGRFVFEALALPLGESLLEARATDSLGNRSLRSEVALLVRNEPPAKPSGLSAGVNGTTAELAWAPNGESDLAGYVVTRGDDAVSPAGRIRPGEAIPTALTASASSRSSTASRAFDGLETTVWQSFPATPFTLAWIEVEMAEPRHLSEARLLWGSHPARDFDVFGELSGRMVAIARVRNNDAAESSVVLPYAMRTSKLRVEVMALVEPSNGTVDLREIELYGLAPLTETTVTDTPDASGIYDYRVSAIDVYGGQSEPASSELTIGDVVAPSAPSDLTASVSLADVTLFWTASGSSDVAGYRVYRDDVRIAFVTDPTHLDPLLANGDYRYEVAAVDFEGNESVRSNAAIATVLVDPPTAPVLSVSVVPGGASLELSWTEATGPLGVAEYVLLRAASSGGPYVERARLAERGFVDDGLANGVPYFYVVRALDPRGEPSPDSNEASATPADSAPPEPPVFLTPTRAGAPLVVETARVDLSGRAEPSSRVTVRRNGVELAAVDALSSLEASRSFARFGFGASVGMALSRDGMRLAELGASGIRVTDLASGAAVTTPFVLESSVDGYPNGIAFSLSGDRIALATGFGFGPGKLHVIDLSTGATQVLALAGDPASPEWLDEDTVVVARDNFLDLVTLSTGAVDTIHPGLQFFERPRRLRASPDGSHLGFEVSGQIYVTDLVTRTTQQLPGFANGFAWLSDEEIVYGDVEGLHRFHVATSDEQIVPGTEGLHSPVLVSENLLLAYSSEHEFLELALVDAVSSEVAALGALPVGRFDAELLSAAGDQRALVVDASAARTKLFSLPGRFELREAPLAPGPNAIVATATDSFDNPSPESEPIEITFDDTSLPDLFFEGEILVVPSVPTRGDVASLAVTVRNGGPSASPPSLVQFQLVDEQDRLVALGSVSVPALPPGGTQVAVSSWDTTGLAGAYALVAEVDPLSVLDERDETNNLVSTTVTVVPARGLSLSVATGLPSYAARQDVEVRVSVVNGADASTERLTTVIEDSLGTVVATLDQRSVTLAYGEAASYSVFWNTGTSLAGTYRARVTGGVGVNAVAELELRPSLDLRATVGAARPWYAQGERASFLTSVTNVASNTPLRNLTLALAVKNGSSSLVFESSAAVPYLALGGTTSVNVSWPRITSEPGPHTVSLVVLDGGVPIASSSGSFEVRPAVDVVLEATLTLDRSEVVTGAGVLAHFRVDNTGVVPFSGSLRVELVDPATGLVSRFVDVPADLPSEGVFEGDVALDTTGLALGRKVVSLKAATAPLASSPVAVFAIPAPPSVNAPAEGASTAQPLRLSVNNATNPNGLAGQGLTYEFEIYLDDSLSFLLGSGSGIPEGTNTTPWLPPLRLEENRRYVWRARARDRFAASDWMAPASLVVDSANEPPEPPSLASPAEATEVATKTPELVVSNALDPEGAPLTYTFEVYRDRGLTDLVFQREDVPEGDGATSVVVATALDEDTTYFWRAQAKDPELDSEWMPTASFRVNTSNQPPRAPLPLRPVGVDVATAEPELVARAGLDPEGEAVTHRFELDRSESFTSPELQTGDGLLAVGDEVRFTPSSPLVENALYFWRVRGSDGNASSDWSETASFRVDAVNEPPSVPRAESPVTGAIVASSTPSLVLVNASDPEEDALRYDFEVYEDAALTTLAAKLDRVREGEGRTRWVVSPRLLEDHTYFWRGRASDGNAASAWSAPESFLVNAMNAPPTAPSLHAPAKGSLVTTLPVTLSVDDATDPDGDALTYRFELYEDEDLNVLVEGSGEIPETSWPVTVALEENHLYYWRARATDGTDAGPYMATAWFRFSLTNEAPTAPSLFAPGDGEVMALSRPTLTVDNATDPEKDPLHYLFEVYSDASLSSLVVASPGVEQGDPRTSWQVSQDLDENGTYFWRALATDGTFTTPSVDVFSFLVDALEEPPLVPEPSSPANDATVASRSPVLVVQNAASPDGRAVHYHFELYLGPDLLAFDDNVAEGTNETRWEVPLVLDPGASYDWRARAVDDRGLASEWSGSFHFTVEATTTSCPPEWREDFDRFADDDVPSGWKLREESGRAEFEVDDGELESDDDGQGAFLFEGSGESARWRNYELRGNLSVPNDDDDGDDDEDSTCGFPVGVVFYSSAAGEYRLEVTGPHCKTPGARLVKVVAGTAAVLSESALGSWKKLSGDYEFRIEIANEASSTEIHVELTSSGQTWWLAGSDTSSPLREGTVGAFASFVEASWDDLQVRELPGRESGISGDENGDGICDVEGPSCADPLEVCLDEGYDAETGLSSVVVGFEGDVGHSGGTACGVAHSYFVRKKTGVLGVELPAVAEGPYRFRLLLHRGERGGGPVLRVEIEGGAGFDLSPASDEDDDDAFVWSQPVVIDLPEGALHLRILSLVNSTVHLEAIRLVPLATECVP